MRRSYETGIAGTLIPSTQFEGTQVASQAARSNRLEWRNKVFECLNKLVVSQCVSTSSRAGKPPKIHSFNRMAEGFGSLILCPSFRKRLWIVLGSSSRAIYRARYPRSQSVFPADNPPQDFFGDVHVSDSGRKSRLNSAPPPAKPDGLISRIRLSSRWSLPRRELNGPSMGRFWANLLITNRATTGHAIKFIEQRADGFRFAVLAWISGGGSPAYEAGGVLAKISE